MQVQQSENENRRGVIRITPFEFAYMIANAQRLDRWASRKNKSRSRQIFWSSVFGALVLVMSPIPFWIRYELGTRNLLGAWSFASLLGVLIVCVVIFISSLLTMVEEVDAVDRLASSVQTLPNANSARMSN
jgi:hypothetical protein